MKRLIFALLCICLLATVSAAFAGGNAEGGYSVKYYKNNCLALVPEDDTVYQYGDEVTVLFEPVEYTNGLIFYGWDWNDDGIADFGYSWRNFVMPARDVTLKAICITPYYEAPQPDVCQWCGPWVPPAPQPAPFPWNPPFPPAPFGPGPVPGFPPEP